MSPRLLALILIVCCAAAPVLATSLLPPERPRPLPRLMESAAEKPITLQRLHISGEISGGLAETTVRMVFFNPNARQLEGNLQFPLLEGQQISAFALDIDGLLRPAVTVGKAKGREVFEAIERQRVDPALLEHTQGNNFKLRVYPIAAMGTRTVELKYTEALVRSGRNWIYRLPLDYGSELQEFELGLKVAGGATSPEVHGAPGLVKFERQDGGFHGARVRRSSFKPSGRLSVQVPALTQPQSFVQEHDGDTYFVTEIPVPATRALRRLPATVGLLWDSSGSGAGRQRAAELVELDRYFRALGNAEVRLTRLRDRAEPVTKFRIVNGNWEQLRAALEGTIYDGASALADWTPQADVGEYLLVSDGLLNYGAARFPALGPRQRLYALNSALAADSTRLSALAERSGGRLLQVDPQKPGAAAELLLTEGTHVARIDAVGATDLVLEAVDPENGLVRVAGKLLNPRAQLTLSLVQDGKPSAVQVDLDSAGPAHPFAGQLWAAYKLRALEADFEANRAAIRRLGTKFGIPTRETSLIVLDRIEDYVRHEIAPPAAMQADYARLSGQRDQRRNGLRDKQMERVVGEFQQKIVWWEKTYPKGRPPEIAMKPVEVTGSANAPPMMEMASPRMLAPPAPAPAPVAAGAPPARAVQRDKGGAAASQIGITLQKWRSDAPYITRMNAASAATIYQVYLDEKPSYLNSSAFYVDAADMLLDKGQRALALRVLSNLAEMDLENRHVLRILGYRLMQAGAPGLAIPVFEKVQLLAEEEPQSFRDLGLAYAAAGQHQLAVDQLYETVVRPWDSRFAEIELIALSEMNAIIAGAPAKARIDTRRIDPRLLKNMPLDVRAVLTWDADNSDMDLWVTDPNGERCFYGHRFTYQGGRMTRDFTGGYGPEEFSLRFAKPGKYKVEANFYGARQQVVAGATTLQVKLTTGFGTAKAKEQMLMLRLTGDGKTVRVGEFEVK
ncbi:MAG: VIT domain-containing protein [Pseudomonadota bacterium]